MAVNITGISVLDPRRQEITSPEGVFSVLQDQKKRLTVFFEDILQPPIDAEAEPDIQRYNPDEIEFIVFDAFDQQLRTGDLISGDVQKASNGEFYIETRLADPPTLPVGDTEVNGLQTVLWKSKRTADSEEDQAFQYLQVYNLMTAKIFPRLRLQVDKAQKDTGTTIGYTNASLAFFIFGGIELLNLIQPLTNLTINSFPFAQFGQLLIDAATIVALASQGVFAIDTDFQYSDQGFSFVVNHYANISGFVSQLMTRFQPAAQSFKMAYISHGALHVTEGPNFRLLSLLEAAPAGSTFRNVFTT